MRHSSVVQLVEHLTVNQNVAGSSPAGGAMMLTVAQSVEHLVVIQKVEGSIPFHQPNHGPLVQLVRTPACHAGGRRFKSCRGRQKNFE